MADDDQVHMIDAWHCPPLPTILDERHDPSQGKASALPKGPSVRNEIVDGFGTDSSGQGRLDAC